MIDLIRGDSAFIAVTITNEADGNEYVLQEGDELLMTVKRHEDDCKPLFSIKGKQDGTLAPTSWVKDRIDEAVGDVEAAMAAIIG